MGSWPVLTLATVAVALLALARSVLFVVRVDGTSMLPTFRPGDAVLAVRRRAVRRRLRRGDIVVCQMAGDLPGAATLLIKRVAAVAGDSPQSHSPQSHSPQGDTGVVPPGRVFVCGDGPASYDSRQFGPIPVADVVGHVVARLSLGR
jgi:signal peptidase I